MGCRWGTPRKDMGPVEVLYKGIGVPPLGVNRQITFPILRTRAALLVIKRKVGIVKNRCTDVLLIRMRSIASHHTPVSLSAVR